MATGTDRSTLEMCDMNLYSDYKYCFFLVEKKESVSVNSNSVCAEMIYIFEEWGENGSTADCQNWNNSKAGCGKYFFPNFIS